MLIKGFDVLASEDQWKRWAKCNDLYPCAAPEKYPCIADECIGSDENGYPFYYYISTVDTMLAVLTCKRVFAALGKAAERENTSPN